jgi:aldose 1-epimerase
MSGLKKIKNSIMTAGLKTLGIILMIVNSSNAGTGVQKATPGQPARITRSAWGEWDGKKVYLFTLANQRGGAVRISSYGATITSWVVPDKKGDKSSIVLGFDSLKGYLAHPPYFGATIGRYGNRIARGHFKIGSRDYSLATNDGKNHLHGGNKGFDKVVWEQAPAGKPGTLTLTYTSKDGEEGYPGNLKVRVSFTLNDDNELAIEYQAETDKATPVNLTNHSYFNLGGSVAHDILGHQLQINASQYTPVDEGLIPTGKLEKVAGTPFDFIKPHAIGERIAQVAGGYDHNFVLDRKGPSLEWAATLKDASSGRSLEVFTTEPGLQFYSGNFLDGKIIADDRLPIKQHTALCLETQHYPDSPNEPSFPSTILEPGKKYYSKTIYKVKIY